MAGRFLRPRSEEELLEREAAGLWRAQKLAKAIGEKKEKITIDAIRKIHRVFFEHVMPEMAGRFRVDGQNVKKLRCMTPPPGGVVQNRMYEFWHELDAKVAATPTKPAKKRPIRFALGADAPWPNAEAPAPPDANAPALSPFPANTPAPTLPFAPAPYPSPAVASAPAVTPIPKPVLQFLVLFGASTGSDAVS